MFERQFGLRENPFAAGHQSKYVYPSREHQEALAHLRYGIENREPFVLITGEVGTGKTTALYDALTEWKSRAVVALITNSALTRGELYEEICLRFGVPLTSPISKPMLMGHLERHLLAVRARGEFAILLIDEAQNLDRELLEEVRLLSNLEAQGEKLLQIFLVGQPELEDKLAQNELRQLRQRIAVHYRLRPLSPEDTERYIHHRITVAGGHALTVFPADACAEMFKVTHGIPREINTVAAQALLNAFVEDSPSVRVEHVRAVQHETEFRSVLDTGPAASAAQAPTPAPAPRPAPVPATAPAAAAEAATSREVRHVPEAAPPSSSGPESGSGHTTSGLNADANVRPAGSAETWQSWMASLSKLPPAGEDAEQETAMFEELLWTENPTTAADPALAANEPEMADLSEPEATESELDEDEEDEEEFSPVPFPAIDTPAFEREELGDSVEAEPMPESEYVPVESAAGPPPPAYEGAWSPPPPKPEVPKVQWVGETARAESITRSSFEAAPRPSVVARAAAPEGTLPPRLRDRLEAAERAEAARGNPVTGWLLGIGAIAAVVIAIVLTMRSRSQEKPYVPPTATSSPAAESVSPPASTNPIPPNPNAAASAGSRSVESVPSSVTPVKVVTAPATSKPAVEKPTTTKSVPASGSTSVKPATPPASKPAASPIVAPAAAVVKGPPPQAPKVPAVARNLYGITVGTFLVEDRANSERARLAASTHLPARVVPSSEGDFRVVLGAFPDRASAENAAGDLITKSLVDEARVMTYPNPAYKP